MLVSEDTSDIKVNVKISVENGGEKPVREPREWALDWNLATMEFLLTEHTVALLNAPSDGRDVVTMEFKPPLNGRRLVTIKARRSKPGSFKALHRVFADIDPKLWTLKLLRSNPDDVVGEPSGTTEVEIEIVMEDETEFDEDIKTAERLVQLRASPER
jgi:hypothetical protein